MLSRLNHFLIGSLLSLSALPAMAFEWSNLENVQGLLDAMASTEDSVASEAAGRDPNGLAYYSSYIARLRLVSNDVNASLDARNSGDYRLATTRSAGACVKLGSLRTDIDYDLWNISPSVTIRQQMLRLIEDVENVINGIACGTAATTPAVRPPLAQVPQEEFSSCAQSNSDPDGDGWGWENGKSCKMSAPAPQPSGSIFYAVATPASINAVGSFAMSFQSSLTRPIEAQIYIKEDGGFFGAYAEQKFTATPGLNYQTVTMFKPLEPGKRYRLEMRTIENNFSVEVFSKTILVVF